MLGERKLLGGRLAPGGGGWSRLGREEIKKGRQIGEKNEEVDQAKDKGGKHGIPRILDAPPSPKATGHQRGKTGRCRRCKNGKEPSGKESKGPSNF